MTEIFVHADLTQLAHCQSLLEEAGIESVIQNETTHDLIVGLPDPLRQPRLCVTNDADAGRARELLRDVESAGQKETPEWKCPQCGEIVPGNFGTCWKCEAPRPAAD